MILLIFISNQNKKSKIFVQPIYKYLERESNPHPTITSDPRLRRERLPVPPSRHNLYLERESNPQSFRNRILNPARLPVSPSRHKGEFYSAGFSEPPHLVSPRLYICDAQNGTVKRHPKVFQTTCFRHFHGMSARGFTSCGPDENRTRHDLPAREFRLPWYMPAQN